VKNFCLTCDLCASRKPPCRRPRAPMQQHLTGVPMERVSLDVLGPLPKSNADNKFILLICDYFTKWVEAFPLPDQEAKTIADKFVKEFVCRYGTPRRLFSDQGSNFQSKLFKEVCQLLEIDKSRTTPYHPQSDGLVERTNRTIEAMMSMFVSPGQRDWDEYLPYIMMAYRSAIQETTGYFPNQMMLGREAELPIDLIIGTPPDEERVKTGVEYVEAMHTKMQVVYNKARDNIQLRSDRQKRNYDLKTQMKRYERGDAIWLHNPARKKGVSPKLVRAWEGPYLVVTRLSDVTYRVQRSPRAKMKVVHFDRMKPYMGREVPNWQVKDESVAQQPAGAVESLDGEATVIYEYNQGGVVRPAGPDKDAMDGLRHANPLAEGICMDDRSMICGYDAGEWNQSIHSRDDSVRC
jgi:hypothetical protein